MLTSILKFVAEEIMKSTYPIVSAGAKIACDAVVGESLDVAIAAMTPEEQPMTQHTYNKYGVRMMNEVSVPLCFIWKHHVYYVRSMYELFRSIHVDVSLETDKDDFWIEVDHRVLNENKRLDWYGFDVAKSHDVQVFFLAHGGSEGSLNLPVNEAVVLEHKILVSKETLDEIQGSETEEEQTDHASEVMWAHVLKRIDEYTKSHNSRSSADKENDKQWVMCMVENVFQSYHWFMRADNYIMWAQLVYKLFTGRSSTQAIITKWNELFGSKEVQADFGSTLKMLRQAFDTTTNLTEHPVLKKFHKLYTYLLVQGFLSRLGLTLNDMEYSKLEMHAMRASGTSKAGLWMAALDVLLFLSEKFYEFYETKDVSVFLHTSSEYSEWLKESDRLMSLAGFTGNLEPHGTTYFSFLCDLDKAIEKGDAYVKYSLTKAGYDSAFLRKRLGALKLTKATTVTIDAASKSRMCPFGVLVYGKSGLGKTSVENMMFYYYAKLRGLDNSESSRYTRNPLVDHWTNFRSSCWCILLDDVAFMRPDKCADIDPTLKEMILICNGVGYAPAQAALEDKGKTPVLCELVMASTNTIDLNASEYFCDPLAVQRRLPHVVTVEVKQQYRKQDSEQLDSTKLDVDPEKFPDYWRFTISRIVPEMQGKTERAKLVVDRVYEHTSEFLQDFGRSVQAHIDNQTKFLDCNRYMSEIGVCCRCLLPSYDCHCLQVQAGETTPQVWISTPQTSTVKRWFYAVGNWFVRMYCGYFSFMMRWSIQFWLLKQILRWRCMRSVVYKVALWFTPSAYHMVVLGALNAVQFVPKRWARLNGNMKAVLTVGVAALAGIAVSGVLKQKPKEKTKETPKKVDILIEKEKSPHREEVTLITKVIKETEETLVYDDPEGMVAQGNKFGSTEDQLQKETLRNVWYNPTIETTALDVPEASRSLGVMDDATVLQLFGKSVVHLVVTFTRESGEVVHRNLSGLYVTSSLVLTEMHLFDFSAEEFDVLLIQTPVKDGVCGNIRFLLKREEIFCEEAQELCMFRTLHNQPRKDIRKFWLSKQDLCVNSISVIKRSREGQVSLRHIRGVELHPLFPVEGLGKVLSIYTGTQDVQSASGDCGSLALATVPRGTIVCGMHLLGRETSVGVLQVTLEDVQHLIDRVEASEPVPMSVQAGDPPQMGCSKNQFKLGPIHHRSKVRYLESGCVNVYGSINNYGGRMKSSVGPTFLQKEMCEHFGIGVDYCAPALQGYEPWRRNLISMVAPYCQIDRSIVDECVDAYYNDIISELPSDWERDVIFLSRRAAVNGLPSVRYIDGINRSSSMGFPFNTSKGQYLVPAIDEVYPDGVDFTSEVWDEYERIEACYKRGERANPVFAAHLKDEAVTLEKAAIKKTRIFTGSPCAWSLVVRSRLLSFVRLVQRNKFAFEAAPGLITMSSEWGRVYQYLTAYGKDRLFAGDYGTYDKKMVGMFIIEAFVVITKIYKKAGFTESECMELMCIGYDTAFSWCNFDGDILEFFGTNPSGHPLTVIINSIVNSLYMRYAYRILNPQQEVRTFKQNVHLITYGDDNAGGVRVGCDWYNHTSISEAFKTIGVTYTMADKGAKSVPYINIEQVSFLKRTWRWDEELQYWMCPLDEKSMQKSLTVWTKSKTLNAPTQMAQVIMSAHDEYFFYGRERFQQEHDFFVEVMKHKELSVVPHIVLNEYDELAARYRRSSEIVDLDYQVFDALYGKGMSQSQEKLPFNTEKRNQSVEPITGSMGIMQVVDSEPTCMISNPNFNSLAIQSDEIVTDPVPDEQGEVNISDQSQTVAFVDNDPGVVVGAPRPVGLIADVDGTEDLQLGEFLARPTLIDTTTWTTSDLVGVKTTITPWYAFLNSTAIKKKLDNFAFMRGVLHVKVLLNGTPFQYGLMRACYAPLLGLASAKIRPNPTSSLPLLIPYSQQPGIYFHPQSNAGGEMSLPFFYHKNWLNITSAVDVQNMGTLNYVIYAPLAVAVSGGSTTVTVQTYAWLTDVELMASTSKLALQGDEYVEGAISGPATAIASIAGKFVKAPVIGKLARATQIGATATAGIARLFGFTNAPVVAEVHGFNPMNGPMLASAHISTPAQKLTLDPKQELSIDPSIHGLGDTDELSISHIVQKESYFGGTSWATTDAVGTDLFNMRVGPTLFGWVPINNTVPAEVAKRVYHTPISYTSNLFKNWRGSVILHIKVVCTKFHKGRLRISYDPLNDISVTSPAENTVYTQILDIGEQDDVEIEIPYHQATGWLDLDPTIQDNWNTGTALAPRVGYDNGSLSVRVLTNLTAPASGSVSLLFFLRAGRDFEFANPVGTLGAKPISMLNIQGNEDVDQGPSRWTIGKPSPPVEGRYGMNFGEEVASLRNILHRSAVRDTVWIQSFTASAVNNLLKLYRIMPVSPGFDSNAPYNANKLVAASGNAPYNYVSMHPMVYIAGPYLGYRGGGTFTVTPSTELQGHLHDMRVYRSTVSWGTPGQYLYGKVTGACAITQSDANKANWGYVATDFLSGLGGMAIDVTSTNGSIQFNIPDNKKMNFSLVDSATSVTGNSADGTDEQGAMLSMQVKAGASTDTTEFMIQTEECAGPDFTCLFYLCCPTLDVYDYFPTPV